MSVIHLYRIPQVVELTTGTGASLMNYAVNRTDFHLSRHVDNEIDFRVRNIDRKTVPLTGTNLAIHISERDTGRILLTRDLTVIDADKGHVRLFVAGDEVAALPKGFLTYGIVMTRADNTQVLLYTDRERKGSGVVEVVDGPLPDPIQPIPLALDNFVLRMGKLYSTPVPGSATVHNLSGQHSVVIHTNGFSGEFRIEGSLEEQPSSLDHDWFTVKTETYNLSTSVIHIPFEGNLLNVRFVVTKDEGDIDAIWYRN